MQHITTVSFHLVVPNNLHITPLQANAAGPYFQGFIMENINSSYVDVLHALPFNPYSQYCLKKEQDNILEWKISALTDEAAEQIIEPLTGLDSVDIRSLDATFEVAGKSLEVVNVKSLTDLIHADASKKTTVSFMTPTAFKSKGEYVFMPSARLVLQNLLMHYSQVYDGSKEVDEETLIYLSEHTRITSYNLRSRYFNHVANKGRSIPAFVGSISLSMDGPSTMTGIVQMLLKFGEYAGVGIKTSMGMGGISCHQDNTYCKLR